MLLLIFLFFLPVWAMEDWHELEIKSEVEEENWIEVEPSLDLVKEFELICYMLRRMNGTVPNTKSITLENGNCIEIEELERRLTIRNDLKSQTEYFSLVNSEYEKFTKEKNKDSKEYKLRVFNEIHILENLLEIKKKQIKPKIEQRELLHRSV